MSGIMGDLSSMIYGNAPGGFDPGTYLARMAALDSQIQSLYASAPQSNIMGSQAYDQIRSMLAPGANGTLSTPLAAMYDSGARMNNINAGAAGAMASSNAQARNLSGSSIEAQGQQNASMQGTLANSSLLASLYGLQNQNTGQLSGLLSQGSEFDVAQNNAMLNAHAAALAGIAGQYGGLAGVGMNQNFAGQMAQYQNAGNLTNSLIGAGITYGMMPSGGGAASLYGGGGMSSSPSMTLSGSGYGMPSIYGGSLMMNGTGGSLYGMH